MKCRLKTFPVIVKDEDIITVFRLVKGVGYVRGSAARYLIAAWTEANDIDVFTADLDQVYRILETAGYKLARNFGNSLIMLHDDEDRRPVHVVGKLLNLKDFPFTVMQAEILSETEVRAHNQIIEHALYKELVPTDSMVIIGKAWIEKHLKRGYTLAMHNMCRIQVVEPEYEAYV